MGKSETTSTVIQARPATLLGRVRAAWQYRHYYPVLLRELSLRKFRNTLLGYWWLILRPLIPVVIAVVAFTYFIEVDTGQLPYGIFLLSGFIAWNLFHSTMRFMARSLMWTRSLMRKMYLPKLLVPAASIGPPLIELAITIVAFIVLVAFYAFSDGVLDIEIGWNMLLFLPSIILVLIFAVAVGSVISVIALLARDIIFSIGWIVQSLMFVTPVLYPLSSVPEETRWVFRTFNPMTGLVETSRWALTGFGTFELGWFLVSVAEVIVISLLCFTFFARAEAYLADVV